MTHERYVQTSITVPREVFVKLEKARRRVPRSIYIAQVLEEHLKRRHQK